MSILDWFHKNKKNQDLRLVFLYIPIPEYGKVCVLKNIQLVDIAPADPKRKKQFRIPKLLKEAQYNTNILERYEILLNDLWKNGGYIPDNITHMDRGHLEYTSKLLVKLHKKYGKKVKSLILGLAD